MAKHLVEKVQQVKAIGIIDKNEDGKYILTVENKDEGITEYDFEEILDSVLGTEISFTSVNKI